MEAPFAGGGVNKHICVTGLRAGVTYRGSHKAVRVGVLCGLVPAIVRGRRSCGYSSVRRATTSLKSTALLLLLLRLSESKIYTETAYVFTRFGHERDNDLAACRVLGMRKGFIYSPAESLLPKKFSFRCLFLRAFFLLPFCQKILYSLLLMHWKK